MPSLNRSLCLIACLLVPLAFACSAGTDAANAAERQTFQGEYQWSQGGDGNLTAEFKPDGKNHWNVVFRFDFGGDRHKWKGEADGSLENGTTVSGTARNGGRHWQFEGTIENGVMTAKHAERIDGETANTGTFRVSR